MTEREGSIQVTEAVRRILADYGVTSVFSLAGASQSALLNELDLAGIRIVSTRHETAAVGAADGYARVRRQVGVAFINADQGLANAVTGIQSAFESCSPVVILVGLESRTWFEPEDVIDHDALAYVRHITKWARTCQSGSRLAEYVEAACRKSLSGRPGPCLVAYPKDILRHIVRFNARPGAGPSPTTSGHSVAHHLLVQEAAQEIAGSQRPIVIAGAGAWYSDAQEALRALMDRYGIPVITNALGRGIVPEDERLGFPWPIAQTAVKDADLVIWAGARLKRRLGYGLTPRFDANAKMIQIETCPEEMGRNRPMNVCLEGDVALNLKALVAELNSREQSAFDAAWLRKSLTDRIQYIRERASLGTKNVNPYLLGTRVQPHIDKGNIIFISDGALILVRMFGVVRAKQAGSYIDTYPLGSMGMGTPMALGAAIAERDLASQQGRQPRRVVLVTGDGSLGFYVSELASAAMEQVALTVLVANNGGWGNELVNQPLRIGRTVNAHLGDIDYATVARGFGLKAERVARTDDLASRIDWALAQNGPSLLDIVVEDMELTAEELTIFYSDLEQTREKHYLVVPETPSKVL
ncbi:MAG: thiamine pyrophosphate-binding protein [Proteobacteria bacterium]|nr:thiamine pyrophosphate-binding protein [Pseudomonadota bacterium]